MHTLESVFGIQTNESGERVSIDTVLALPAFLNGTRLIASTMARADLFVYRYLDQGGQQPDPTHNVWPLLTGKVNPFQNYFSWRQALVSNAIWSGNGYSLTIRDELGQAESLYNLDSREVYPIVEYTNGRITGLWYGISTGHGPVVVASDDMVHIKNLCLHQGVEGVSLVDRLRLVLGKQIAQQKFSAIFFKNGSHIEKVLKVPGWLDQEQQESIREQILDKQAGIQNANRTFIAMGGTELTSLPISAQDSQLVEGLEMSITEMANILGLSSRFLGAKGVSSYGSLYQDSLDFLNNTADPWMTSIEAEFNTKLLLPSEQAEVFIEFDRDSLFSSDPSFKTSVAEEYQAGLLSFEEARRKLNRSTDAGTMKFIRNGAFKSVDLIDIPEATAAPANEATTAPADLAVIESDQPIQVATDLVLNGAQIVAATGIVAQVAKGEIPRDAGIGQLTILFNLKPEQAEMLMGSSGTSTPTTPNPRPVEEAPPKPDVPPPPMTEPSPDDNNITRSVTEAALTRIKTRIQKAIIKDPDLSKHYDVIRDNLPGRSERLIESLNMVQDELTFVLPEQRAGVLEKVLWK